MDECRDVKQSWPSIVADALIVRYVFPAVLKAEHFSPGGAAPWSERDGTETAGTVGEKSLT